jgi:hypothetical protein
MSYKEILKLNTMKRNFLMMAVVSLFTVVALCSCSKDDDEKKNESKNAACEIVSFVVNDTVWNIDGKDITYEYSSGFQETSLTPAITLSPGATVNPPATEAQNFFTAQGVTYTVTADDGQATKTYTVHATVKDDDDENNTITVAVENGASFNETIDTVKVNIKYAIQKRRIYIESVGKRQRPISSKYHY